MTRTAFERAERFVHSLILSRPKPRYVADARGAEKPEPVFGLERLRDLLERLGRPDKRLRFIHIVGSNGKTSTAHYCAAALQSQGYKVGLHVSPHMRSVCERFTINSQPCKPEAWVSLVERVKPILDEQFRQRDGSWVSYFELMMALAFWHFADSGCDFVVLEAGLGGRYDGSNVIDGAELGILTSVGLDHTHILGSTKAEIALDKLGILRSKMPFLTAERDPEIQSLIKQQCQVFQSPLKILGQDFSIHSEISESGLRCQFQNGDREISDIQLSTLGQFQADNLALALQMLSQVHTGEWREPCLRETLSATAIPGRMERVSEDPVVVLDGAHNPDKIEALVSSWRALYGSDSLVVYGATSGRDLESILQSLSSCASRFYLTRPMAEFRANESPLECAAVLRKLDPDCQLEMWLDPWDAFRQAMTDAKSLKRVVLVTGSLYLISEIKEFLDG